MNEPTLLLLVAGPGASGKSHIGAMLAQRLPHTLILDKDVLTGPLVDATLAIKGEPTGQRDSAYYVQELRPLEYAVLLSVAMDNIRLGRSVIAVAPFIHEVNRPAWIQKLEQALPATAQLWTIWVESDLPTMHARMQQRNAPYDRWKLENRSLWEEQLAAIPRPSPGPRCLFVHNGSADADRLEAQLDTMVRTFRSAQDL